MSEIPAAIRIESLPSNYLKALAEAEQAITSLKIIGNNIIDRTTDRQLFDLTRHLDGLVDLASKISLEPAQHESTIDPAIEAGRDHARGMLAAIKEGMKPEGTDTDPSMPTSPDSNIVWNQQQHIYEMPDSNMVWNRQTRVWEKRS